MAANGDGSKTIARYLCTVVPSSFFVASLQRNLYISLRALPYTLDFSLSSPFSIILVHIRNAWLASRPYNAPCRPNRKQRPWQLRPCVAYHAMETCTCAVDPEKHRLSDQTSICSCEMHARGKNHTVDEMLHSRSEGIRSCGLPRTPSVDGLHS